MEVTKAAERIHCSYLNVDALCRDTVVPLPALLTPHGRAGTCPIAWKDP
jgi:hypothetical protein